MEAPPLKEAIKKTYNIISDKNKLFNIEIYNYHNSIYIYSFFQGEIIKEEYEKKFSDTELKMNKYLSLLDSIDEIFDEIINIFDKKTKEIKIFEDTNQITINLPLEGIKIKDIILVLDKKVKKTEETFEELYNLISILKTENNSLKQNQKNLEEKINKLEIRCPFPVDSIYTQYPNCKEPKELWKETNWEIIDFNGAFFRAVGGNSNEFGKIQNEGLPNITGNKLLAWTDSSGGGIIMGGNTNNNSSALYSYQDSNYYSFYYGNPISSKSDYHHNILGFNANRTNKIYGNSNHVTPLNYSIKIWKRIS
jgi:hypothetical protein